MIFSPHFVHRYKQIATEQKKLVNMYQSQTHKSKLLAPLYEPSDRIYLNTNRFIQSLTTSTRAIDDCVNPHIHARHTSIDGVGVSGIAHDRTTSHHATH
jgi:hypothetical protein